MTIASRVESFSPAKVFSSRKLPAADTAQRVAAIKGRRYIRITEIFSPVYFTIKKKFYRNLKVGKKYSYKVVYGKDTIKKVIRFKK